MDAHKDEYSAAAAAMRDIYGGDFDKLRQSASPSTGRGFVDDEGILRTAWEPGEWVKFRHRKHGELLGLVLEAVQVDGPFFQYVVAAHVPGRGRQHFGVMDSDVLGF